MRYFLLLLFSALVLTGCAKQPTPPQPTPTENAQIALAESANSINHSLEQLAANEQAANPPVDIAAPPSPATYGMAIPASLHWTGPAETAVQQIAVAANYHFAVIGQAPSLPVIVNVNESNSTLGDILRNIGLQCGKSAQVVVIPSSKTIELRYPQSS